MRHGWLGVAMGMIMVTSLGAAAQPTETLFGNATPQTLTEQDPNAVELGVKFSSAVAGQVTGIRFYKGPQNRGTHKGHLWTAAGMLLASVTFTNETASGWQTANFSTPVQIAAGATYVASYWDPKGYYSVSEPFFTAPYTSGDLSAPVAAGVYHYGSDNFPTLTWNDSNYFVDVGFIRGGGGGGQSITGVTLSGSTFTGGASSGTVVGMIGETLSPSSPAFSGSLSLSGADAASFQIVGSSLETNGVVATGTYNINIVATQSGLTGSPFTQPETITGTAPGTAEVPGPSAALFNSPYYTCVQNRYVGNFGSGSPSDANAGTSQSVPWATLQHANDSMPSSNGAAGYCINVANGTYSQVTVNKGGNLASSTGYLVWRCATLDGCAVTPVGESPFLFAQTQPMTVANYNIIDGFVLQGPNSGVDTFGQGAQIYTGNEAPSNAPNSLHHVWLLNSIVSGNGQSGVQFNDGEYFYVVHNTIYNNSRAGCSAQGSGISFAVLKSFTTGTRADGGPVNYVRTADDESNPILGNLAYNSTWFNNAVAWNVVYNNRIDNPACGSTTDGNGIIMDTLDNGGSTNIYYPGYTLIAFNVVYNNGGRGIDFTASGHAVVANNTTYNSALDPKDTGTYRPEIGAQADSTDVLIINNLAYAIVGASPLTCNAAFTFGGTNLPTAVYNTPGHNISFVAGSSCNGENPTYNGNVAWSCSANQCATSPLWVSVGGIGGGSAGNESTPPSSTNFALQSGSPAIGYGTTQSYLSSQAADAGACYHALSVCP